MSPFDGLATEMIMEIIEAISSCRDDLLSISLVSRLFIVPARQSLFSDISITGVDRIHRLATLIGAPHCTIPRDIDSVSVVVNEQHRPWGTSKRFVSECVRSVNLILKALRARNSCVLKLDWPADTFLPIYAGGDFSQPQLFEGIWLHWMGSQRHMLRELVLIGRFSDVNYFIEAVSGMSCLECLVVYARWRGDSLRYSTTVKPPSGLKELRITSSSQAMLEWLLAAHSDHSSLRLVKVIGARAPEWFTLDVGIVKRLFHNGFDSNHAACLWIDNHVQAGGGYSFLSS